MPQCVHNFLTVISTIHMSIVDLIILVHNNAPCRLSALPAAGVVGAAGERRLLAAGRVPPGLPGTHVRGPLARGGQHGARGGRGWGRGEVIGWAMRAASQTERGVNVVTRNSALMAKRLTCTYTHMYM